MPKIISALSGTKKILIVDDVSEIDPSLPLVVNLGSGSFTYRWPALIDSIGGNHVILKYPLPELPALDAEVFSAKSFHFHIDKKHCRTCTCDEE